MKEDGSGRIIAIVLGSVIGGICGKSSEYGGMIGSDTRSDIQAVSSSAFGGVLSSVENSESHTRRAVTVPLEWERMTWKWGHRRNPHSKSTENRWNKEKLKMIRGPPSRLAVKARYILHRPRTTKARLALSPVLLAILRKHIIELPRIIVASSIQNHDFDRKTSKELTDGVDLSKHLFTF